MDRRIAHDAVVRPAPAGLELRLDEGDDLAAPGARVERDRPEDEPERDERDVDDREGDRLREASRPSGPGVRPLHRDDARIAPQRLGELAAAHVESVDPARAALQQHVREAAGRRADVEADAGPPDRSRTRRAPAASLWPPRLTYGSGAATATGASAGRRGRPACGRARAASPSPTRTLPARTSAWARLRVSTRPRSTSSWSSRIARAAFAVGLTRLSWHSGAAPGLTAPE